MLDLLNSDYQSGSWLETSNVYNYVVFRVMTLAKRYQYHPDKALHSVHYIFYYCNFGLGLRLLIKTQILLNLRGAS